MSSLFEKEWFPDNHGFLGPVLVLGPGMSMWKAAVRHERHGVTFKMKREKARSKKETGCLYSFEFEFELLLQATYGCLHQSRLYATLCWFGPRVRFSIVDQTCDPPYVVESDDDDVYYSKKTCRR